MEWITRRISTDAVLISIFRRWGAQQRALDALPPDVPDRVFAVAVAIADDIALESVAISATGIVGLAVKAYIGLHSICGGRPRPCVDVRLPDGDDIAWSLFADVVYLLPAV